MRCLLHHSIFIIQISVYFFIVVAICQIWILAKTVAMSPRFHVYLIICTLSLCVRLVYEFTFICS